MNIEDLTLKQIREIQALATPAQASTESAFMTGKAYFIRTVTYASVGLLTRITDKEFVLSNASWVADTGRFHNALRDGTFSEIEPFINDVVISRDAIVDATEWQHPLPDKQK